MPIALKAWLRTATGSQRRALARTAKTSVPTLRNIASGFRRGSAEAAVRIANAADKVPGAWPIDQASVCPACRRCKFYKAP